MWNKLQAIMTFSSDPAQLVTKKSLSEPYQTLEDQTHPYPINLIALFLSG